MIVEIKIENKQITILLKDKKKVADSFDFPEDRQLSEKLLPSIHKLLAKNKLKPGDIEKMEVKSDLGENFTTYRIAKAVVNAFNWAKKNV